MLCTRMRVNKTQAINIIADLLYTARFVGKQVVAPSVVHTVIVISPVMVAISGPTRED